VIIKCNDFQRPALKIFTPFQAFSQNCEKRLLALSCLSVRFSAWKFSASTGRNFIKLYIRVFFENLSRNFKFHYNRTRITGTLHDNQYTFLVISRLIPFRVENVSDKCCRENDNILCAITFPLNRAVYEIMWKSIRERDGPQMTIWRMRIACWIPKATNTH
jgi:hypothetical protein